ncbi:MAG: hypothetical protein PHO26_00100 [Dehalococcoidia bacterium]|nr:hypothetical protein [Dehalococcoidia bacterium]MDD5493829.1 hypothetical protein [Dehalococcoidia bacterium]
MISDNARLDKTENANDDKLAIDDEAYYNSLIDAYISANKTDSSIVVASDNISYNAFNSPLYYEIYISFPNGAPMVNRQSPLKIILWTKYSLQDINLEISLPDGIEPVNGDKRWTGDVAGNSTQEIDIIFSPIRAGDYKITATLSYPAQPSIHILASQYRAYVYFITTGSKSLWGASPFWQPKPSKYAGVTVIGPGADRPLMTEEELRILEEKVRESNRGYVPPALCENGTVIRYQ